MNFLAITCCLILTTLVSDSERSPSKSVLFSAAGFQSSKVYCSPSWILVFSRSGRAVSVSGVTGPFRAFPKSLSVDFGGLSHPQQQSLPQSLSQPQQQQQPVSVSQTTPPVSSSSNQDKYAAVLQLDSVFSDTPSTAGIQCLSLSLM